jgi:hypothetical protein
VAPAVSRFIKATGPFSASATVALKSLGAASVPGRKALIEARPIISDLPTFAAKAKPLAKGLAGITTSLHDTGGIERLMDYIFYQVAAINGFDSFGHYLRASLILNLCSTYATTKDVACSANFEGGASASAASHMTALQALHQPGVDLATRRTAAILRGMSAAEAIRLTKGEKQSTDAATSTGADVQGSNGDSSRTTAAGLKSRAAPAREPSSTTTDASGTSSTSASSSTNARLLDYLLGNGN